MCGVVIRAPVILLKLEQVQQYKNDSALTWEKHAEVVYVKISKRLGVFRRVRGYSDRRVASMMYNTLILSLFDYNNAVVGNRKSGIPTRLQRLQNRGCIILGWNRYSHRLDIIRELRWLSIVVRVKLHIGVMVFECHQKE